VGLVDRRPALDRRRQRVGGVHRPGGPAAARICPSVATVRTSSDTGRRSEPRSSIQNDEPQPDLPQGRSLIGEP